MAGIRVVISPTMDDFGRRTGAKACEEGSGRLIASGSQARVEGDLLVVEEIHYDAGGNPVYKGELYFESFGHGNVVKDRVLEGHKQWDIFHQWF
jgi:hypothetical protein